MPGTPLPAVPDLEMDADLEEPTDSAAAKREREVTAPAEPGSSGETPQPPPARRPEVAWATVASTSGGKI
eukprot:9646972-Lingulodinium_polyedra.AAC.1